MRNKNKFNSFLQLFTGISIVILLNVIGSFVFERFDLTAEKRYSLSPSTKKLLKELDDVMPGRIMEHCHLHACIGISDNVGQVASGFLLLENDGAAENLGVKSD